MTKSEFMKDQIASLSIQASFARGGGIYAQNTDAENKINDQIRSTFKELLAQRAATYVDAVDSDTHIRTIEEIADKMTAEFKHCLFRGRFRIGTSQKAFNLYLKYMWCLDRAAQPPHCPFDGIIIQKLSAHLDRKILWTRLDSPDDYRALVDAGLKEIRQTGHKSLSEWELEVWRPPALVDSNFK